MPAVEFSPPLDGTPRQIERAHAKLNLYLRVTARRPDGFHELETVMASLDKLADTLQFEALPTPEIELVIRSALSPRLSGQALSAGPDNLVLKAVRLMERELNAQQRPVPTGLRITLVKRLPAAAGLGGGSSDAATTLRALNHLWNVRLSRQQLAEISAELGSDVPFFLADSPWVLCTGRGEILDPVRQHRRLWLVLARPQSGLSTPQVFRHCQPEPLPGAVEAFLQASEQHPLTSMAHALHNTLQAPAEQLNAEVSNLRRWLDREAVLAHQMTGSGSAYFAMCSTYRQACCVAARLRAKGVPWVKVSATRG